MDGRTWAYPEDLDALKANNDIRSLLLFVSRKGPDGQSSNHNCKNTKRWLRMFRRTEPMCLTRANTRSEPMCLTRANTRTEPFSRQAENPARKSDSARVCQST